MVKHPFFGRLYVAAHSEQMGFTMWYIQRVMWRDLEYGGEQFRLDWLRMLSQISLVCRICRDVEDILE